MSTAKRACATAVAALGIAAAPIVLSGSAFAAPYVDDPACSVSTGNPDVGGSLGVSCDGFDPNEQVRIELHSKVVTLKVVTANGAGSFATTLNLPGGFEGEHFLTFNGLTSGDDDRVDIFIGDGDADNGNKDDDDDESSNGSGGRSALPRTGAAVGGLGLLGAALVGGGVVLKRRARR